MKKKGQAALEFLMTYGWAILAAVIVIGVLYFLIGNPSNLAGDKFLMAAPFSAGEKSLVGTSITLEISNGAGKTLDIDIDATPLVPDLTLGACGTATNSYKADGTTALAQTDLDNWAPGTKYVFKWTGCTGVTTGSRFNEDIKIPYKTTDSSLTQSGSGSLSVSVK